MTRRPLPLAAVEDEGGYGGKVFRFDAKLFHAMAEIRNHAISLPFVHKIFVLLKRPAFCQMQIARKTRESLESI